VSYLLRQPNRPTKYYNKRALILRMDKYHKQYNYSRNKSTLYQNARFHAYGSELSLINTNIALSQAIRDINLRDGETISQKHGVLLLLIKHYVTANNLESFDRNKLYDYYPNLSIFFGSFADNKQSFLSLFTDLMNMQFINPLGNDFAPTHRLKGFCRLYEKHCNKLFSKPE
jgi:hypothetical protein